MIEGFTMWLMGVLPEVLKLAKRDKVSVHGALRVLVTEGERAIKSIERSYRASYPTEEQ